MLRPLACLSWTIFQDRPHRFRSMRSRPWCRPRSRRRFHCHLRRLRVRRVRRRRIRWGHRRLRPLERSRAWLVGASWPAEPSRCWGPGRRCGRDPADWSARARCPSPIRLRLRRHPFPLQCLRPRHLGIHRWGRTLSMLRRVLQWQRRKLRPVRHTHHRAQARPAAAREPVLIARQRMPAICCSAPASVADRGALPTPQRSLSRC